MTLDQLRIFVAVADQQHVTRAANVLALSQSAVSSSIAALEAQYDVKQEGMLTGAGQQFLSEARAVLARAWSAGNMLADGGCGEVRYRLRRPWQITGYRG